MSGDAAYEVAWTSSARRSLNKIPRKAADTAISFIYGPIAEQPRRVGKPLRFELEARWSARRGDYRVIYRINDRRRQVVIELIHHRSDIYRRR